MFKIFLKAIGILLKADITLLTKVSAGLVIIANAIALVAKGIFYLLFADLFRCIVTFLV